MKFQAELGYYTGYGTRKDLVNLQRCSGAIFENDVCICLIYTRDIGLHSSGWLKNPDYERGYHLSVSFKTTENLQPISYDFKRGREIVKLFFAGHMNLLWAEGPFSDLGKKLEVYHHRLFCDARWQPILPRKEVYTKDFTEKGWKSFSELYPGDSTIFWGGGEK